jgi:CRP-like cAMP-binding protein
MTNSSATPKVLESLEPQAITLCADRDEVIVAQGDRATYCYLVMTGCVRTVKLMNDGRRQICEFLLPGDLFGWDALDEYDFTAEAVTPLSLRRYIHGDLYALADRDRTFACWLRGLMVEKVQAGREHTVLLGRQAAAWSVGKLRRHLPSDGTLAIFYVRRERAVPKLGLQCHRHDQYAGANLPDRRTDFCRRRLHLSRW